jgi:hypothetical protein
MKEWVIAHFLLNELQIGLGMRCQVCNSLYKRVAAKADGSLLVSFYGGTTIAERKTMNSSATDF